MNLTASRKKASLRSRRIKGRGWGGGMPCWWSKCSALARNLSNALAYFAYSRTNLAQVVRRLDNAIHHAD